MAHPFAVDPSSPRTLAANVTLSADEIANYSVFSMDPAGARDCTIPDASAANKGQWFYLANLANAAEVITVKSTAQASICTPTQAETAFVVSDGTTWSGHVAASS